MSKRASHDKAQASSLYLFFYYFGSSVGGTVGGLFWMKYGWMGVIAMIALFLFIACVLSFLLKDLLLDNVSQHDMRCHFAGITFLFFIILAASILQTSTGFGFSVMATPFYCCYLHHKRRCK